MTYSKITVKVNGEIRTAEKGARLSEIVKGDKPCGAHGKCGKCKVKAYGALSPLSDTEREMLRGCEIREGVRLSCLTSALGECEIFTLDASRQTQIVTDAHMPTVALDPMFSHYGLAVDIGTTTIVARIYNAQGEMLSTASALNAQGSFGADVVSRVEAAIGGKGEALAASVREAIDCVSLDASRIAGIDLCEIDGAVITGNTVMLTLFTLGDAEPFSHAPFDVKELFGVTVTAGELGLKALLQATPVYLPPCISAFVGADITCGILSTEVYKNQNAMLVDIGTNGEMALWHDGHLTVTSVAAGPAFEGVGISSGMRGECGAIDRVKLEDGELIAHVIGEGSAMGICGSGLVDTAACMLELGALDESGYLEDGSVTVGGSVSLTQRDIRMLQLAKSAICAGLVTLACECGISLSDVPGLYIAGGFGNYLDKRSAVRIGLLREELAEVSRTVGNAALSGASMLLLCKSMQDTAASLAGCAKVIDLSTSSTFSEHYISGMSF